MEDSGIVELYFERSESAISETAAKYGLYLKKIAYNILRDLSDTDEIVNDTYLGAWNAIPPTRPVSLKHFLSRITRNLSLNRVDYQNAERRSGVFAEFDECIPDEKNSAERAWESKEIAEVLNEFLKTLGKQDCAVFLARYFYAQPIKDIAKRYVMTERQVNYKLSKMRNMLRDYLERKGVAL